MQSGEKQRQLLPLADLIANAQKKRKGEVKQKVVENLFKVAYQPKKTTEVKVNGLSVSTRAK